MFIIYYKFNFQVPITPGNVTLKDFKLAINKPNYNKFFFRSEDDDFG